MTIVSATQVPELHAELVRTVELINNNFCMRVRNGGISFSSLYDYNSLISNSNKTPSLSRMADESLTLWRRDVRRLLGLKGRAEVVVEDLEAFLETASAKDKISLDKHVRKMCSVLFTAQRVLEEYIEKYGDEALNPEVFSEKERTKVQEELSLHRMKMRAQMPEGGITF